MTTYNISSGANIKDIVSNEDLTEDQKVRAILDIKNEAKMDQVLYQLIKLNTYIALIFGHDIGE